MVNIKILSGFNNYYNRQIKLPGYQSILNYSPYVIYEESGVNFVPNDFVNTQHTFGNQLNYYDGTGDYLIVVDDSNEIESRWFIIESVRDRAGQYTLTLRRDLVADYYNKIVNESTFFIEKATLNSSDPFIYNKENSMSFNQIKTDEWQITDKTRLAWIVGFIDREFEGFKSVDTLTDINIKITNPPAVYITSQNLEDTPLYKNRSATNIMDYQIDLYLGNKSNYGNYIIKCKYTLSQETNEWSYTILSDDEWNANANDTNITNLTMERTLDKLNNLSNNIRLTLLSQGFEYYVSDKGNSTRYKELWSYNGEYISCNNIIYNVSTTTNRDIVNNYAVNSDISNIGGTPSIKTYLSQVVEGTPVIKVHTTRNNVQLNFTETQEGTFDFQFSPPGTRRILEDAPYDMFCIPYGSLRFLTSESLDFKTSLERENALTFAQQLAENLGTNLFDLQLLPYCPLVNYLDLSTDSANIQIFDFTDYEEGKDYQSVPLGDKRALILWSRVSRGEIGANSLYFSHYNEAPQNSDETTDDTGLPFSIITRQDITNTKIANECNMFRLCSPNWNGQFEFNPAKFREKMFAGFNVDFTYLPYSSYIHIAPAFSGLYGKDYNDARGLICQGDFSISYEGDAFVQYQINNKNYLNTFNRQIQNMEINQSAQRDMQIFNAIAGTVMGGAAGATMGAKAGGPGAIIGGIAGGVLSAVGGAMDIGYGEMLRNEALDFTKDNFGYQLDNIKALPDSIAKVTSYTENNKLFPTLEFYTCTDKEKEALANKIAYNGMTVMRIGKLNEFIGNKWNYKGITTQGYIKGKLIRFPSNVNEVGEDYHVVNAISGELDKGVYL